MMNKNFKLISLVLTFVFCFSAIAFGQETTGNIEGTVRDPNGAVIPNATVTVRSTGTTAGYNRTITTNASGYFFIQSVLPGTYELTATGSGFRGRTTSVSVSLGRTTTADFSLEVAGVGQTEVEVIADSQTTIAMDDTKIDTNISRQVFENLPKGTTFSSILKAAPNVRPEALAGGFQVDGASGSENVFVIDGQEVTNFRTGQLNINNNLPFELLQEVQVKSTGFEAEYGGATGGVINVVTIGGNDQLRGNFGISFEPSRLQGNSRLFLNRFGTGSGQVEYFQPVKNEGVNFFPTAALSGPIVRGKLWYSAIYAPQVFENVRRIDHFTSSNPNIRTISSTQVYQQKLIQEQAFFRLDAQPTSRLRLFGSFLWNPLHQEGILPTLQGGLLAPANPVNFGGNIGTLAGSQLLNFQGGRQNSNNINGQVTWTPLNSLMLNFRAGRSFLNEKLNSYNIPNVTRFFCHTIGDPAAIPGSGCVAGQNTVPTNNQINYDVSTRTTYDVDASIVNIGFARTRNNLKFGYQRNELFNTVSSGHVNLGVVVLAYNLPIDNLVGGVTPTPGNLGSGWIQRFGTVGEASSVNQAVYIQDTLQIGRRVTFNIGVRLENEIVPSFGEANLTQAIEFGWTDKVAPRFGVAIDLTGDGKTKLFGSYGWFYDRFKYELPRGSFGGDFFKNDYFEILPGRGAHYSNYTFANILGSNPVILGGQCPITNPTGWSRCQLDFRIPTNLVGGDIFDTGGVDPNIKAARQSEYTIGLERQLGRNFIASGRFTHKQIDRAVEDIGVFNAQGSEAYIIGNPGFGLVCEIAAEGNYPCPKAERTYDAVEFRVEKRATKYFFNGSYTWSRLFGNYSGLASSDEAGRASPNVNRFFDLPPLGFNAQGEPDNGLLATDRPHVFKAYGGYTFDWRGSRTNSTTISAFTTIQSGTPLTTIYNLYSLGTTILNERGDLGRTEMFTETDLSLRHRYRFGRDNRLTLEGFVDLRNIFDEKNELTRQTLISGTNFNASTLRLGGCTTCGTAAQTTAQQEAEVFQTIFNRGGIRQFVNNYINSQGTSTAGLRNDYNMSNSFQVPRGVRFGARLYF
jgi:hypothetical protein